MKNTMISNKELEALQEIYTGVDHFFDAHERVDMNTIKAVNDLESVHALLYMDMVRNFIDSIASLRGLVEIDEKDFAEVMTDDGKRSLKEVRNDILLKMCMRDTIK